MCSMFQWLGVVGWAALVIACRPSPRPIGPLDQMPVITAIAREDEAVEVREFGAPAGDGIDAESTLVDIGSITKLVSAVMTTKLVEQGKIDFDHSLADLLGDQVPADKSGITLHQLLTHTAGFVDSVGNDFEDSSKSQFLERAFSSQLVAAPGERYAYSNVGYGLVAAIVERHSGKSYEDYLRHDVLAESGIELGYDSIYDDARSLRSARGKTIRVASWGGHAPGWNLIGNGGLVATARDVVRFRRALVAGKLISKELLARIQTPHVAEDDEGSSFYGYGIVVEEVDDLGTVYWHDGGNDVFSAELADFADQHDIVFTAGADSRRGDAFEAMEVLAEQLYGAQD